MEDRIRWGVQPGVISDQQVRRIARVAEGDARVAIGTLRAAARRAREDGLDEITADAIAEAVPEAKAEIKQKTSRS